ncbi:shikimate dehydrogenase [Glaciibacter superstes]|uniref:shikimate dehydrogenase n=1 Tax=Glaciibacter superstes TaxID=501023 RepID=UPI0003B37048|nr:shikimate dehydrogenase [Glaciibacter superstes]
MVDSLLRSRRLAVLGSPIGHSRSPVLHDAAYRTLGLHWRYEAAEVGTGELAGFVSGLGAEWRGLSLTMPLKHEILPLLDETDRVATLTGAVNTVLLSDSGGVRSLTGFNTDVAGIVRALAEAGLHSATAVTILGAGATASSAVVAAAELGAERVDLVVRTSAKAAGLVRLGRTLGLVVAVSTFGAAQNAGTDENAGMNDGEAVAESDLVISTLPGGSDPGVVFPESLRRRAVLFDVAYAPWPSVLAESWQAVDGTVLSGLAMLLHQALVQVRIFVTGDPFEALPDEENVLRAMRAALAPAHPVEG